MNRKIILIIFLILAGVALYAVSLYMPSRVLDCCHGEQYYSFPDWVKYTDLKDGFTFAYPKTLKVSTSSEGIRLTHSIPFPNNNGGCDFKGDSPLSKDLTDFDLLISIDNSKMDSGINSENYSIGELEGLKSYMGVEGCGITEYDFLINQNKKLVVKRYENYILSESASDEIKKEILLIPGVIPREEAIKITDRILASFRLIK